MRDHRKLDAFQSADQLVIEVYKVTNSMPKQERSGLVRQMRRSAVSVPANIAEGCGRATERELVRFLDIAFGSLRELEYYISLIVRLGYCREQQFQRLLELQARSARQLSGLIRSFRQSTRS